MEELIKFIHQQFGIGVDSDHVEETTINLIKELVKKACIPTNSRMDVRVNEISRPPIYPIELYNKEGLIIFYGYSNHNWYKKGYINSMENYYEDSSGYWETRDYDEKGRELNYADSEGFWEKKEYGGDYLVRYQNSKGDLSFDREVVLSEFTEDLSYEKCITDIENYTKNHEVELDKQGSSGVYRMINEIIKNLEPEEIEDDED